MVVTRAHAQDDVSHHVEKERVIVDGQRPHHGHAELAADLGSLDIEVVEHLDVIADEADRD